MKNLWAILITLGYAVLMTLVICWHRKRSTKEEGAEDSDYVSPPSMSLLYLVMTIAVLAVLRLVVLDNWPTIITLVLLALIIPMLAYSFPKGAVYILTAVSVTMIMWQFPSITAREEKIVDEEMKIASVSNANGRTDSAVIEDRGQYFVFIEVGNGDVSPEKIPADIVNGHYIDEEATPMMIYHYSEFYKRTFWSKERTKFVERKLKRVDLFVKRDQLVNTF